MMGAFLVLLIVIAVVGFVLFCVGMEMMDSIYAERMGAFFALIGAFVFLGAGGYALFLIFG